MNLQEEYVSDCESDEDYYVDLLTSGKGSDESESDMSNKSEKYPVLKSKHTAKALRKTRHSDGDNKEYRSKECDDLHSEEESEKSRSDALWADFLGDVVTKSVINKKTDYTGGNSASATNTSHETCNKYDKNATAIIKTTHQYGTKTTTPSSVSRLGKIKRLSSEKGIGTMINKFEKKKKLTVLERSQLDWKNFKQDEGIDELLCSHNKGKDGYLDRQDFLERTDLRQFEIEKKLRLSRRPY
ncbi:craniofacial development protein 1 [Drosophila sechellia]|uniref:Craniofacial development protein 1 n=1 Tax=Drosophila sechellia TaxID=7238 RepID=B4IME9_DROSE|nr:craniofacial development protein 1 [Drosophila sechellia]EDW46082.1 GM11057 [Drosophila sechellia]